MQIGSSQFDTFLKWPQKSIHGQRSLHNITYILIEIYTAWCDECTVCLQCVLAGKGRRTHVVWYEFLHREQRALSVQVFSRKTRPQHISSEGQLFLLEITSNRRTSARCVHHVEIRRRTWYAHTKAGELLLYWCVQLATDSNE